MDALTYFNSLKSQGYGEDAALTYTNQHYPDFRLDSVANVDNYDDWFYQNFQQIAAECYPDDEGVTFDIASITNNGEFIEVVAHSNPTIGYDPVRYDFSVSNGTPSLEHGSILGKDGTWGPFFSTGNSDPQPTPMTSTSNAVADVGNYDDWFYQKFQQIAAECYPDDEGAIFTIASITNNGEYIEVIANSNPSIGYDPVRYDFSVSNGTPSLEHTFTLGPYGTWEPFFSTGKSDPQPAPVALTPTTQSNSVYQAPQQVQTPQPQQIMGGQYQQQQQQQYAPQQPMMQGQPMQAFAQNPSIMSPPSTNAVLALVLAIIGIVTSFFYGIGLFFAIPALILANGSLTITNQFPNHPDAGIAKAAKVCAWVAIGLFLAVIGLVVLAGILYVWAASLA